MDRVLGFDTSTAFLSVAITDGDDVLGESELAPAESGRPRHAQELLGAVDWLVADTGGWERIELVAVGIGPGTFTGLRIGVATARALAQSRGLPMAGVSSLHALALGSADGAEVLPVLDAKRSEVFAALYASEGIELWEPWVGPPGELADRVSSDDRSPLAVGDGAVRFRDELQASGALVPPDEDPLHRLRARCICQLAAQAGAGPLEEIKPTYLRRPDAELWRERDRESEPTP